MVNERIDGLCDLALRGDADRVNREAVAGGFCLVIGNGGDGVRLAGGVDNADGGGVRLELADQVELRLDGELVGRAGDVALVKLLPARDRRPR